ncbi:lysophospholipid acyltransferase family protein [Paludibacterium sp.]|uniref:lysophospholipid acyltransferase family protein n=1 Tax=Paludibacterium sp. TaxID=1917523 RepID=UPI0025E3CD46|nr:lysophospholipid acyltransferase family protein [Paludibacterium sp.]MBV8647822.1 1-acyl-sn-glycerol-3-phosphate acyltransferase [Paludibacterium sp.]
MPHTTLPTRLCRLARMGWRFLIGFSILAFRYTRLSPAQQTAVTTRWCRQLLATLALEVRVSGQLPATQPGNTLLVSNHVSWLDIIALAAYTPPRFVAKREIRGWPVIGWMVARGGTLFIDRTNRRDASRVNQVMAESLRRGDCLCVFPEGTTTTGHHLLPFKSSLFESALLAGSMVQPVTLRYLDERGEVTTAPSYAGDTTFWQSLASLLKLRKVVVEVHYGQPLTAGQEPLMTRFELSEAARHDIAGHLKQWLDTPDTQARTAGDPQVEAP